MEFDLEGSKDKFKMSHVQRRTQDCSVVMLDGKEIQISNQFRYFGFISQNDREIDTNAKSKLVG